MLYLTHTSIFIGFVWSHGRKGQYIKTNGGGVKRRRPGLPRGSKMAPQGCPTKRKIRTQNLPLPVKRPPKTTYVVYPTTLIVVHVQSRHICKRRVKVVAKTINRLVEAIVAVIIKPVLLHLGQEIHMTTAHNGAKVK